MSETTGFWKNREWHLPLFRPHARTRNQLFRYLAGMLKQGYPLPEILACLADSASSFRPTLMRLAVKAEEGAPFGRALEKEWSFCPKIVSELARLGDRRGALPETLALACELIDPDYPREFRGPIKFLLIYLGVIMGTAVVATLVVMSTVMPALMQSFSQGGARMPGLTMIVLSVLQLLSQDFFLCLMLALLAAGLALALWYRLRGSAALERAPVLGRLLGYSRGWKLCYGVGALMRAGVSLDEALAVLGRGFRLPGLVAASDRIKSRVEEGMDLGEAVEKESGLSPAFRWGVSWGLARGDLAGGLIRVGEINRELYASLASRLIPVMEIVAVVCVVGLACLMVASVYYPLFVMAEVAG